MKTHVAILTGIITTFLMLGATAPDKGKTFPTQPTMTATSFKPDPVDVNGQTVAKLAGTAKAPTKVEGESQAGLTWTWKVDKVQLKSGAGVYNTPAATTYEIAITNTGANDSNATVTFRPKAAGDWKVTVHGVVTFTDESGAIVTGTTEPKELKVAAKAAAAKTD